MQQKERAQGFSYFPQHPWSLGVTLTPQALFIQDTKGSAAPPSLNQGLTNNVGTHSLLTHPMPGQSSARRLS